MVFPDRERFRAIVLRYFETPGAKVLQSLGFTPNIVTILGFSVSVAAALVVGSGFLLAGGAVFLAAGIIDLMDGALARLTNRVTEFGALLDSVMDRLGEAALFLGMAIYGLRADDLSDGRVLFFIVIIIVALTTSQAVSYVRARGEGLGVFTKTGLMTRPERVAMLSLGLVLGLRALEIILIVIAAVSFVTLLQRMFYVNRALMDRRGAGHGVDKTGDTL